MRTNYTKIKNIITKNINIDGVDSDLFNAEYKGVVLRLGDDRVRIELVDFSKHLIESTVGIHLKLSENIEHDLLDSIETAFKDNYPTIYIHQQRRSSEERRAARLETVRGWLKKPRFELNHSLNKIFNVDSTLESMTEEQLDLLLAFIAGIYQSASSESREHWTPKYHNLRNALEERGVDFMKCIEIADAKQGKGA